MIKLIALLIGAIFFLITSCTLGTRSILVNHTNSPLTIEGTGRSVDCMPGKWTSFKASLLASGTNAITIKTEHISLVFEIAYFDESYLDKENRTVVFVFEDDHKLYLSLPTKDLPHVTVKTQPTGYPLVPTK